jgi:transcriptional regulator with XRE-family HTH domain
MITSEFQPIGSQIRELRKAQRLSLKELASRAGTSAPALHRYEAGWDRFEIATLRRIAAALGAQLEVRLRPGPEARSTARPEAEHVVRKLAPVFWDRKLTAADLERHPQWVIARILMYGNLEQVRAVSRYFSADALRAALKRREIDARTRNYWRIILDSENASEGAEPGGVEVGS